MSGFNLEHGSLLEVMTLWDWKSMEQLIIVQLWDN